MTNASLFHPEALQGQSFVVTGASSGIGQAIAQLLAAHGGRVVACGRDAHRLSQTMDSLQGQGHSASEVVFETADATTDWLKSLARTAGVAFNGIFHGAGQEMVRPVQMVKDQHLDAIFAPTIRGCFGIARAAASKSVLADGGSLVVMTSVAGLRGQAGMTAYSASKAALDGLVRSLACEFAPRRVRVNSIAAAAVRTAMHERLGSGMQGDTMASYERRHPLGFGDVADVAAAALFLLSPASRWITGTTMLVDGGFYAQ